MRISVDVATTAVDMHETDMVSRLNSLAEEMLAFRLLRITKKESIMIAEMRHW